MADKCIATAYPTVANGLAVATQHFVCSLVSTYDLSLIDEDFPPRLDGDAVNCMIPGTGTTCIAEPLVDSCEDFTAEFIKDTANLDAALWSDIQGQSLAGTMTDEHCQILSMTSGLRCKVDTDKTGCTVEGVVEEGNDTDCAAVKTPDEFNTGDKPLDATNMMIGVQYCAANGCNLKDELTHSTTVAAEGESRRLGITTGPCSSAKAVFTAAAVAFMAAIF